MKISSTPAPARNSKVYSISGVFDNGKRHRGLSNVKGANRFWYESVRRTACNGSGCSSSFWESFLPFGGISYLLGYLPTFNNQESLKISESCDCLQVGVLNIVRAELVAPKENSLGIGMPSFYIVTSMPCKFDIHQSISISLSFLSIFRHTSSLHLFSISTVPFCALWEHQA
jgi:hypothetical protein